MKTKILLHFKFGFLLWLLLGADSIKAQRTSESVKVLSYNIHHCNPPSKADYIDLPAIARVIRDSGADLVALQEVDVNTERSGKGVHQARELANLSGMHFYFVKNIDHQGGDYGVAILSRFPVVDSAAHKLPMKDGAGGEPRGVAEVRVRLKNEKEIIFASTHLDLKPENRKLQAEELNRLFKDRTLPVILAGDFNAVPGSEPISILDKNFQRTCNDGCGFTIPVINPDRTIDFIMYGIADPVKVLSHKVINESYASDHLPVFAELEIE